MSDNNESGIELPLFQAPVPKQRVKKSVTTDKVSNDNNDKDDSNVKSKRRTSTRKPAVKKGEESVNSNKTEGENKAEDSTTESTSTVRRRDRSNRKDRNRKDRSSSNQSASKTGESSLGSTRTGERKSQRRKDSRSGANRRNTIIEADFLAGRDNVRRRLVIRNDEENHQVAMLEDDSLVEFYVSEQDQSSVVGNVYIGTVQNVLPGMEAAFVDIGVGRNGVLYAGEVNWNEAEIADGTPKRIEQVLNKGDQVLVQATKDPIGNKGARLTSQITLAGRYLVLVPSAGLSGISKKIPDRERRRLKEILSGYEKESFGIIFRTSANGVSEENLVADIERLKKRWEEIEKKAKKATKPTLLYGEADLWRRVIREFFNASFEELILAGDNDKCVEIEEYVADVLPDFTSKITRWTEKQDVFEKLRINEQLTKALDRKVWLPSGGTLIIDRTEAMTIIDINTGKFTGSKSSTLEETVTANNLEAAEEIVRQLRLRDIGGIIIIDFIDMILEKNRELVLRRLIECLMRDKTKHQVAEVTSLGLVQITRKRVGQGLLEAYSTNCEYCNGRGYMVHDKPVHKDINAAIVSESPEGWFDNFIGASHELEDGSVIGQLTDVDESTREDNRQKMLAMAAAAAAASVDNSISEDESEGETEAEVSDDSDSENAFEESTKNLTENDTE